MKLKQLDGNVSYIVEYFVITNDEKTIGRRDNRRDVRLEEFPEHLYLQGRFGAKLSLGVPKIDQIAPSMY